MNMFLNTWSGLLSLNKAVQDLFVVTLFFLRDLVYILDLLNIIIIVCLCSICRYIFVVFI
jgi:hypothetical protein